MLMRPTEDHDGEVGVPLPQDQTRDASAQTPIWRRLAPLLLAIAVTGLPLNHLLDFFLFLAAALVILTGEVVGDRRRWLAAIALTGAAIAVRVLVPAPSIEEGHNVFLIDGPGSAVERALPADAFRQMQARFDAAYSAERRCPLGAAYCWRNAVPATAYASSSDALFHRPLYSRRVSGIDFSDPATARFGFVNELALGWPSDANEIVRFRRDPHALNLFDRFHVTLPLFVMYRFPADFVGSALCWKGDALWEGADKRFAALSHDTMACRILEKHNIGRRIFGVAIGKPLAMRLNATASVQLRRAVPHVIVLAGLGGILVLLVRWRPRRLVLPLLFLGCALVVVTAVDFQFIGGFRPLDGGDDGIVYEDFGQQIARNLFAGDFVAALRGGEAVYYFTPGMRYVRALEDILFGDTFLLYFAAMLALPFLVLAVYRRFLPMSWALLVALLFVATPLGVLFGSSYLLYVRAAARGYADPMAFFFFLSALVLLVPRPGAEPRTVRAFFAALLFAAAVFTRPNLVLATAVLLTGAALFALLARQWRMVAALCLGFAPILLSPLHNWVFGHALVLFSDNVVQPLTMRMLPSDYLAALGELMRLDFGGDHVRRAVVQLTAWLSGPSESWVMVPLHAVAIVILLRVALFGARFDRWLRLTALAMLLQHGIGVTYVNVDRYHLLTWLLTCLVALAWLNEEGLALLDRRYPGWRDRLGRIGVIAALNGARLRVQRACDPQSPPSLIGG